MDQTMSVLMMFHEVVGTLETSIVALIRIYQDLDKEFWIPSIFMPYVKKMRATHTPRSDQTQVGDL